jgi:serine/threonine protein kinase/tetratricopeptide (TPR) repeat protein
MGGRPDCLLKYNQIMTLKTGTRLGVYEILAPIGAGGMGEVYRALDTRLGRKVAMKVLPQGLASDPVRLARFEREAKTVAALNHPNIVVLHSIEEADGVRLMTMELVDGRSLDDFITPGGLPLPRILDLAIPLADALAAAHQKGVVHRDLKPANVMVTGDGRVKVLDFGLARTTVSPSDLNLTAASTLDVPVTAPHHVVGTIPYMAPEQIQEEPVDAQADLFSFGILLYELATGRRPFVGQTFVEVASAILRDSPVPLRETRPDLPPDFEHLVGRCLEKNRAYRIRSARDVRSELETMRRNLGFPTVSTSSTGTNQPAADMARVPSIAVVPFVNRSRDADDEYFSEGLADELLSVLAKIRGLHVAARSSSATFKGRNATVAEVGRALNVATVLEGSVRKSGNRVRISVQLVKVEDGYHLWSETYDRSLDDIFAVQDDIAQRVVKELRGPLLGEASDAEASGSARAAVAKAGVGRGDNPEAHWLYLQGRYLVQRLSEAEVIRGLEYLEKAVTLDPAHAPAWAAMGWGHIRQATTGHVPAMDGYIRARREVNRALELAPDLPEAYVVLCWLRRLQDWDWQGSAEAAKRALELAPGSAEALAQAGILAFSMRRMDEALDCFQRGTERDPLSTFLYGWLGQVHHALGQFKEAEQAWRKSLELSPARGNMHALLSMLLARQGRDSEAVAEANLEPSEPFRLTSLAFVHQAAGRKDKSDDALGELEAKYSTVATYQIALVHAVRDEADLAFAWMDRGFELKDPGFVTIWVDPLFKSLHGDPRWKAFIARMGFIHPGSTPFQAPETTKQ